MVCDGSWLPSALAAALPARSPALLAWLAPLRLAAEEYDPLVTVTPPSPPSPRSDSSTTSPDSAFDEILSQIGTEIYKLDEYHRNLNPQEEYVSLSILNIFDGCLDNMGDSKSVKSEHELQVMDSPRVDSDGESGSDASFKTSTPRPVKRDKDVNVVFAEGQGPPIPPPRVRLKPADRDRPITNGTDKKEYDSDSESTCWSYKECSTDGDNDKETYSVMWNHSSGYHNSDRILKTVLSQNHATISRVSFHTATELPPEPFSVYALQEVGEGDRCNAGAQPVDAMTPDDGYEPVRDAITDENHYEEIEYGCSFIDEGYSCGGSGSVEVESCSLSASEGRESPLYANLADYEAYAMPADVLFWKNLLLDPFYNEDEEDDWITPEECAEFTREQRPPLIPRIKHRTGARAPCPHHDYEESHRHEPIKASYEPLEDWSPTSDRSRSEIDRSFSKDSSDSPPLIRLQRDAHRRIGGSTENLQNIRRPYYPQIPASSSGDSLDVEIRDNKPGYSRNRKSRSMVTPKQKVKTPIPAPRLHLTPTPEAKVIEAGAVKRTKFSENGGTKKCRKNWVDCYMVLTPTALIFYKDERTYSAFKVSRQNMAPPSPNAPRPELILPLMNAHIMQCLQMHTKRYTRSLVLNVQYDQYLIQLDSEEKAKMWLDRILSVHFNLGPPKPVDLHHQSSSTDLDSLGRTPPVSRHINKSQKAGGSSNEDLGDPVGSIPKSHVRRILRNFFPKRPTMDSLMKTGIYKDEQVFGRHLADSCAGENPQVPPFVVFCVKQIESSVENMCADGLYRASGNLSQVQKIRLEVDQSNLNMQIENLLETISDIHVLTGSLKLFFRELKEPLIPCSMFDRILAACSIKPKEAKVKEFRDIVNSLPQCNRDTLKFLLEHLLRVTEYSEQNRMHTANLAIVFGPTLLWAPAEQAHNIAIDCIQQNLVVEILLNEFKEIFDESKGKKKS